jgi:hypothetical protein
MLPNFPQYVTHSYYGRIYKSKFVLSRIISVPWCNGYRNAIFRP